MTQRKETKSSRRHEVKHYAVKVRDVMTSPIITLGPMTPYHEIVDCLLKHNISGLPIVDKNGELLGIVTEADLITKEAYDEMPRRHLGLLRDHLHGRDPDWVRKSSGRNAQELMTRDVAVISPDEDLAAAARMMLEGHHKRLPVVEGGAVIGLISRHDLLRPFHRTDQELAKDVEAILGDPLRAPEGHQATFTVREGVVNLGGTTRHPSDAAVLLAFVAGIPGVVAVNDGMGARHDDPGVDPSFDHGVRET